VAVIQLEYSVIGCPACLGCEDMIVTAINQLDSSAVFIIADADEPGQREAK
jgi:hypothetical protein